MTSVYYVIVNKLLITALNFILRIKSYQSDSVLFPESTISLNHFQRNSK